MRFFVSIASATILSTVLGSCAHSEVDPLPAALNDGATVSEIDSAETGGPAVDGEVSTSSCSARHCSADLHSVVDCDENVTLTCPSDKGCAAADCVPACESARINGSTYGCEYYASPPDSMDNGNSCFVAFIANTWTAPVTLTVEYDGKVVDGKDAARIPSGEGKSLTYAPLPDGKVPAGEVALVFLSDGPPGLGVHHCPAGVTPVLGGVSAAVMNSGFGKAFRIQTSAPVVAYDIYPFGGGESATTGSSLLLPTASWGTNYLGVSAYSSKYPDGTFYIYAPWLQVVAYQDDTKVTIKPIVNLVGGGGVGPTGKGIPATYTLSKGRFIQFTQPEELTGSAIQSDKPIGVWGGHQCLNIPLGTGACDSAHMQLPAIQMLGNEYVAVRHRNRIDGMEESAPWRVVGVVDGTSLTYEPAAPAGAPSTLTSGQLAEFRSAEPFIVRSQDADHPFYMTAHMAGAHANGPEASSGDPETVPVVSPAQYLKSYVFFTDPTYSETNLVVVRKKSDGKAADVVLDCAGTLTGWKPIGSSGLYEFTRTDLVRHNFQKQGTCDNGRHEIHSTAPFGLTVWGWGTKESGEFFTEFVRA